MKLAFGHAIAATIVMLALSGCGSESHHWDNQLNSVADKDTYACQEYGNYYGTKSFDECLKYIEARRTKQAAPTPPPVTQTPNSICQTRGTTTDCQTR
jgi:hypothetical protein